MNVISFITLLQNHPMVGFLLALVFFVFMFGIKNGIIILYSRDFEKRKQEDNYSASFSKPSFPSASIGNLGVEPMDPRIREDDEKLLGRKGET